MNEHTDREEFILVAALWAGRLDDVQGQAVFAQGEGPRGAVLEWEACEQKKIIDSVELQLGITYPITDTRISIIGSTSFFKCGIQALRILETEISNRRLCVGNAEEKVLIIGSHMFAFICSILDLSSRRGCVRSGNKHTLEQRESRKSKPEIWRHGWMLSLV